ncbi:hypothetical protein C7Y71_009775 [Pseudoprevotella muciniphila]|uniref:Uncharacterized protein n=1 Tax=Pseudoprevotella muciniphila TaxID=2133944 RepID=A0A5P8E8Q3_9BACT|nr:hypothetical protein [Pseudoprevotella muciniphila]QFQ13270.1 hypothetical protein C7Y71_009775 [Pseudoprevotella muciniphila]
MKAITILRALLKESINTENCGIVRVHEELPYTEFIRKYLYSDFQDKVIDYHRFVATEGEYFYCWNSIEIDFNPIHRRFGCGFSCYVHYIDGQFLHIMPLDEEESEVD